MINLVLHNVNTTLVELVKKPETANFLDANRKRVLEDFGMGVKETVIDAGGQPVQRCVKKVDGELVEVPQEEINTCFPVELTIGGVLSEKDMDGDGDSEGDFPIVLRMGLNPHTALTAKLISSSAELGVQNNNIAYPPFLFLTLEVDLADVGLQVFIETKNEEDPQLVSWCTVFPTSDPRACQNNSMIPVIEAKLSGRITLTVQASTVPNMQNKYVATGGVASREKWTFQNDLDENNNPIEGQGRWKVVTEINPRLTYLKPTLVKNNTPTEDLFIEQKLLDVLGTALKPATFGAATLPISIELPARLPEAVEGCDTETGADNEEEEDIFALLHDFGFAGLEILHPMLKVNSVGAKHLGIGFHTDIQPCNATTDSM